MLYIIVGEYEKRIKEIEKILDTNREEGDKVLRLEGSEFDALPVEDSIAQESMFGDKAIYILSGITDTATRLEKFTDNLAGFVSSENIFILHEDKIAKPVQTACKKAGGEIIEIKKEEKGKRRAYEDEPFNLFLLTDALGKRDKKNLWILYRQAADQGAPIEEIHGLFNWQVKNMIMVQVEKGNPGMHPFLYQKTAQFARNYTLEELRALSLELVRIFHERETGISMEIKLEEFILAL